MIVKLLTEHHLEFLSLKGGCRGSSESTLVKMSNCWKYHAAAQMIFWCYSRDTMIYAMSGETKGLPKLLHILSEVVNRPVFSPEEVSVTACFDGETTGDKNISILHLSSNSPAG